MMVFFFFCYNFCFHLVHEKLMGPLSGPPGGPCTPGWKLLTYTNLLHLFLNQSFLCFLQLVSFISSFTVPVCVFHSLHAPLPSSKHLLWVLSKHDHNPSHHLPLPAYPLLPSIATFPLTVFLMSTNFTLHITLTIDLSALLKIATSSSLKHHVSLPYNIADLTELFLHFFLHPQENLFPCRISIYTL